MSWRSAARRMSANGERFVVELARHGDGDLGDTLGVSEGVGRFCVDHERERLGDTVQPLIVGAHQKVGRFEIGDVAREVRAEEGLPERRVVSHADKRPHETRVEPAAASSLGDLDRRREAMGRLEDLDDLRESEYAAEQGDVLAAEPSWVSFAIPVLVEGADCVRDFLWKVEHEGDLGAALATDLRVLACGLGAEPRGAQRKRRALPTCCGTDARPDVSERLGDAIVVDELHPTLQLEVIRPVQGTHAGSIRGTSRVFQQQAVEERRPALDIESDLVCQPHPDQAAADRVPERVPVRHIQRVGQRGDDLRETQRSRSLHDTSLIGRSSVEPEPPSCSLRVRPPVVTSVTRPGATRRASCRRGDRRGPAATGQRPRV